MNPKILSLIIAGLWVSPLWAEEEEEMEPVLVEGTKIEDVSIKEVKSADVAEALAKKSASISLVRRSGIANDIILRGQKKDNINVLIDGTKIYGACPNRMDPPISYILSNNIESIQITEGPYDVQNFGTLSGAVKITTREPEIGFNGEISLNAGSWNYYKGAVSLSGGNEFVRALISYSYEESDQYEDGDGRTFAEQIEAFYPGTTAQYKPEYWDQKAYQKQTLMAKLYFDLSDNQELKLSYTGNRSDDVLYPNSKMDALYDDSDAYEVVYALYDLGRWSKDLEISYYHSEVEHPMSTYYRLSSGPDSANEMISALESSMDGFKIKNTLELSEGSELIIGFDSSRRNWDGTYEGEGMMAGITGIKSIPDVDTDNLALFVEWHKDFERWNLQLGARYDDTEIDASSSSLPDNDYSFFSAYGIATWSMNDSTRLFAGLGQSHRVPDARELYFQSAMMGGMLIGNPDLDPVTNTEIDFGIEQSFANLDLNAKLFYSWLNDFIFYNASKPMRRFENQDATLYGLSIEGTWYWRDDLYLDFGLAYQRGEKEDPLSGQTDTDMPEIPPLKVNLALNWQYHQQGLFTTEVIAANNWSHYDGDNGEQYLSGWAVLNLKLDHQFTDHISGIFGVDNLFDKTYAVSNTYQDLTLLFNGDGEIMLLNEPGRYIYGHLSYRF